MVLIKATMGSMVGMMVNMGVWSWHASGIHHRWCWRRSLMYTLGVSVHGPIALGLLLVASEPSSSSASYIMGMEWLSMLRGAVIIIIWRRGLAVIKIWHRK